MDCYKFIVCECSVAMASKVVTDNLCKAEQTGMGVHLGDISMTQSESSILPLPWKQM